MTRRRATILLHWLVLVLLLLVLASGRETALFTAAFGLSGLAMGALALAFGRMNGPGPKLTGPFRQAHPWLNRAMYLLLVWTSLSTLALSFGAALPGPGTHALLVALVAATALHALFNLWRHMALVDGALRRITPRSLHGML
ncbi:hypothetical protein [Roseobacter litoralis]|uniref:hypothetical protein n=1 Tax=Roseobacter litoralis TaxID=42443 RepID=UPI00248FB5CF|nr:hypothetical protein [Roseobacter litoralis]